MKLPLLALRDHKTDVFFNYHVDSIDNAKRSLANALRDDASMLNRYQADFSLHQLGELDTVSGIVTPFESPVLVVYCPDLGIAIQQSNADSLTPANEDL